MRVGHAWRVSVCKLDPLDHARVLTPRSYTEGTFTECDGDASYPPGLYPLANGSTSTFAQRYTGTYTAGTSVGTFTVGQTVTPQTPYATPASSNCLTYSTIGNGESLHFLTVACQRD